MSDFVVDFTDVKGGDFEALPAGTYLVALTDWSQTETKNAGKLPAGTPGINWEFTVQEGEYENRKLWTNHWLHPNTLGFLKSFFKATGRFEDDELDGPMNILEMADELIGTQVRAVVARREYNGDMRNEIKRFRPVGDSESSTGSMLP